MNELQEILECLKHLTPSEQRQVQRFIEEIKVARRTQRKKELWGNVVAAIQKYENEIEYIDISILDFDGSFTIVDFDENGGIVLDQY